MNNNEKLKMNNDKEKFKKEFRSRIHQFILRLIRYIESLPKDPVSLRIADQLMRSDTSIGANYIEARGSSSKKDFINFFHYALKSANKTAFWLDILNDSRRGDFQEATELRCELKEITKIFAASLLTLKRSAQ